MHTDRIFWSRCNPPHNPEGTQNDNRHAYMLIWLPDASVCGLENSMLWCECTLHMRSTAYPIRQNALSISLRESWQPDHDSLMNYCIYTLESNFVDFAFTRIHNCGYIVLCVAVTLTSQWLFQVTLVACGSYGDAIRQQLFIGNLKIFIHTWNSNSFVLMSYTNRV